MRLLKYMFSDLFSLIFCCFEAIVHSPPSAWNRETRSDAQFFLLAMSQFSFIVALISSQTVLGYTKGLSVKLQGRYVDVVRAYRDIESIKTTVKGARSRVDSFHSSMYQQVLTICQSVDVVETAPRQAIRQQHRQNIPASNVSEYYKRSVTIPILDQLINELDTRFDTRSLKNLIEFVKLLPSEVVNATSQLVPGDFSNLLQLYGRDLPCTMSFDSELDLWQNKWTGNELSQELNSPANVLKYTDYDYFPNIHTLIVILVTLPVTSCECERSISMLKLIKTPLRSTMTQKRLNGLAMLQYHKDIPVTADELVQEYVQIHPRRLLVVNPLDD